MCLRGVHLKDALQEWLHAPGLSRFHRRRRLAGKMRFLRFNGVGVVGFLLQITVLAVLLRADVHYLIATAIAVECAVLHNFFWHERWTWVDRPAGGRARLRRLGRFHALNGVVSLVGNLLLMRLFVGTFGMAAIPANVLSVLACAAVNYVGSDRIVFDARDATRDARGRSREAGPDECVT